MFIPRSNEQSGIIRERRSLIMRLLEEKKQTEDKEKTAQIDEQIKLENEVITIEVGLEVELLRNHSLTIPNREEDQ